MLAPWKKNYDIPRQCTEKQGHQFADKFYIVKALVFPVMYRCENSTTEKAEHQRTEAFQLWCCRRIFKSPLDCKKIKPVNPKGNQP